MEADTVSSTEALQSSDDLRVAIGRIARRIKQLYEAGENTFSETSLLARLNRAGPATLGALAATEHVRPQAIVALVNGLEERGFVTRRPDPSDGRKVVVALTERGRSALADKGQVVTQRLAAVLLTAFSPEERAQLTEVLPLLERLAGRL
jgi:DNA-binding MarR family transcriptional regulator